MTSDPMSSKSSSSNSSDNSPNSTISTAPLRMLRPRLPITYNEAAWSPQVRMLNSISILLPPSSNKESPLDSNHNQVESPTEEAEANSPHSPQEESPVSTPDTGLPLQRGGVNNQGIPADRLPSQTTGGVTNDEEDPPDQLPRAKTREEHKNTDETKDHKHLKLKDIQS